MSRLTIHTVDTAPEAARERVAAAEQANGFLPNLIGVLANAPAALETYQVVGAINGRTSLSPAEREVVQITAATLNDCGFCVAGHTKLSLQKLRLPAELVEALRKVEAIDDPKLDALARFSVAVIEKKVRYPTKNWPPSVLLATPINRRWKSCWASAWQRCATSPTAWLKPLSTPSCSPLPTLN